MEGQGKLESSTSTGNSERIAKIPLGKSGKFAIIDSSDLPIISIVKSWYLNRDGYAEAQITISPKKRKKIQMHRVILGATSKQLVDHASMDKLDNRRENIRFCNRSENSMNRVKIKKQCLSKYKGVSWSDGDKRWTATIHHNKKVYSKSFLHEINAALWYDKLAVSLFGGFARTNFCGPEIPIDLPKEREFSSIHKGVAFDKARGLWVANFRYEGKIYNLGRFKKEEDAALAYAEKYREIHGCGKTVLFSAKCSVVHPGHIVTIMKLAREFGEVKVVLLDYPERRTTINYALQVFNEVFKYSKLKVSFLVSPIHFGKITKEEIEEFSPFDIYASGNMEVLKWIENLGIPTHYVERSFCYKSSDIELENL